MPRWLTWTVCVLFGAIGGGVVAPCMVGAVGDLMGADAEGPGFVGVLFGLVLGPVVGGVVGAAIAWRTTHPAESAEDAPAA